MKISGLSFSLLGRAVCAIVMAVALCFDVGAADTSWMPGKFGLSFHWTAGIVRDNSANPSTWGQTEWNAAVNAFDTEALAQTAKDCGADYVIFTVAHALQQMPCPNAALDRVMAGRTATRDMVGDLLTSLEKRSIRLILYYNHSCNNQDDPPWMQAVGYNSITNEADMAHFATNICNIVRELSDRYGRRISGWWFDSGTSIQAEDKNFDILHGQHFPWADFIAAARHGNANLPITVNGGENRATAFPGVTLDYAAGENTKTEVFCAEDLGKGYVPHVWTCADDARWLWSKKNGFCGSRFSSVYALKEWIVGHRAAGRLATLNVLIDDAGTVNPTMVQMLKNTRPLGTVWEQTRYEGRFHALPAVSNAIAGLAAEFTGTRWTWESRPADTNPTTVLTDGKVYGKYDGKYNSSLFGMASGSTLTWTLTSAVDLYGFNAYSFASGGGNDGYKITSIEVKRTGSDTWAALDLPMVVNSGIGPQNNSTGGTIASKIYNNEGETLAKNVTAIRVTFGTIEGSGSAFPEMEVVSAPASGANDPAPTTPETGVVAGLEAYGPLTLVDSVACATDTEHEFHESKAGLSYVTNILGSACRVLEHQSDAAKYFSYRLGKGKGLVAQAMYLLVVEYPEDAPRTVNLLNRAMNARNGFHTGTSVGDTLGAVIIGQTHPESMSVPLSQEYRQLEQVMFLNEKAYSYAGTGDADLISTVEEGFDVIFHVFDKDLAIDSAGAAIRAIKLYRIADEAANAAVIHYPANAPRRLVTWRDEMGKHNAMAFNANGYDNFRMKTRLMKILGINCWSRDMLEFGYNQYWDVSYANNGSWYNGTEDRWSTEVGIYADAGVYLLPYYEYAGSRGPSGIGVDGNADHKATPLFPDQHGSHYNAFVAKANGASGANVDLTCDAAVTDFEKILDCTILRYKDRANFVGAWIRNRGSMPISFSAAARNRFCADTGRATGSVTLETLCGGKDYRAICTQDSFGDEYKAYRAWWYERRARWLQTMQQYLSSHGVAGAKVFFSGPWQEAGIDLNDTQYNHNYFNRVACQDTNWKTACGYTGGTATIGEMSGYYKMYGLDIDSMTWYPDEYNHASPRNDPETYTNVANVAVTYPYNCIYTTIPAAAATYRNGSDDLFFSRHYCLYEGCGAENGYFTTEMDRCGRAIMLPELYAMAYQDPTVIGFLQGGHLARNCTKEFREFTENYLSLPAVKGTVITGGAWGNGDITVRKYVTSAATYYAVINTSGAKQARAWRKFTDDNTHTKVYKTVTGEEMAVGDCYAPLELEPYQMICYTTLAPGEEPPVVDPSDPTDPTDPTEPSEPTEPTDPTAPTDPANPEDPTEPTSPSEPSGPTGPVVPDPGPGTADNTEAVGEGQTLFVWNRPTGGSWSAAENWLMADGSVATRYPKQVGDVAVLNGTKCALVSIGRSEVLELDELRFVDGCTILNFQNGNEAGSCSFSRLVVTNNASFLAVCASKYNNTSPNNVVIGNRDEALVDLCLVGGLSLKDTGNFHDDRSLSIAADTGKLNHNPGDSCAQEYKVNSDTTWSGHYSFLFGKNGDGRSVRFTQRECTLTIPSGQVFSFSYGGHVGVASDPYQGTICSPTEPLRFWPRHNDTTRFRCRIDAPRFVVCGYGTCLLHDDHSDETQDYCVSAGTLQLGSTNTAHEAGVQACTLGTGDVVVGWNGTLDVQGANALRNVRTLRLKSYREQRGTWGKVVLNASTSVGYFYMDRRKMRPGRWGATGSGAEFIDDERFAGLGVLKVLHGDGFQLILR